MMGIPVIVSDIPEQSNLVRKYNIGIIAKLNQAADLAKQISEKKTDRKQAIIKAQKELNWQMEKKKLISIYATPFK
jgi:glycosyltransferase involved in cell wall biosynthesis